MKKIIASAILISLIGIMAACKRDTSVNDYDEELSELISSASNGVGPSYFMLPASNDYASIPQDPNNPITYEKVVLGKLLFHETALGTTPKMPNGIQTYSCASCHHAGGGFQANVRQGISEGGLGYGTSGEGRYADPSYDPDSLDVQPLRTPTAMNGAWQRNMLWNGQFGATGDNVGTETQWTAGTPIEANFLGYEGLEIQAIAGLKVHRMELDSQWAEDYGYRSLFDIVYSNVPTSERYSREYAGLAIAAYERTIVSDRAPFQEYLQGDKYALTEAQKQGAIVFFGKGNCTSCHTGPALNSESYHAIGMEDFELSLTIIQDYGQAQTAFKGRGGFTGNAADEYKFKVPQLYNMKDSPFFGHGGSFTSLHDLMIYKNDAVAENSNVPTSQLAAQFQPLNLSTSEIEMLVDFLENGLYDPDLYRYQPSATFSGNCIPNNDVVSQIEVCLQ